MKQPGFQPATFDPPAGRTAPASAPVAPSRPAVLNAPRQARNEPPSSPASGASNLNDEQTVDVERAPIPKWRRKMVLNNPLGCVLDSAPSAASPREGGATCLKLKVAPA